MKRFSLRTDDAIDPNLRDFIRAYIECPAFDHDLSGSPRDRLKLGPDCLEGEKETHIYAAKPCVCVRLYLPFGDCILLRTAIPN
jgi:hypothetical protein